MIMGMRTNYVVAAIYFLIGLGIAGYLTVMLNNFPLFDFAVNDLNWTREWLYMTIIDYYGASLCLSVVVLFNEPLIFGLLWAAGFNLLGSPICCSYVVYRLLSKNGLKFMPENHRTLDDLNNHGLAMWKIHTKEDYEDDVDDM